MKKQGWSRASICSSLVVVMASSLLPAAEAALGSKKDPSPPATTSGMPSPPAPARRENISDTIHGKKISDPYRWLERMKDNSEATKWLEAHDSYARSVLAATPDSKAIVARMRILADIEDRSPPIKRGKRYFFYWRKKGQELQAFYEMTGRKGTPRVLIDPNKLSKDGSISLGRVSVSHQGRKVAYTLSENATDQATLHVIDVATKKVSKIDTIRGIRYGKASWEPNEKGFYYNRLPLDPSIPKADLPGHAQIYYHRLGTDPKEDQIIFNKTGNPRKLLLSNLSKSGKFLFVHLFDFTQNEVLFKDLRRGKRRAGGFKKLATGKNARFEVIEHGEKFYIRTDFKAPNGRVLRADPRTAENMATWQEIVPENKTAPLRAMTVVGGKLALKYLLRARTRLVLLSLDEKKQRVIKLPGLGFASNLSGEPDHHVAYYSYSSYLTPPSIFEISVRRPNKRKVFFSSPVPINPKPFEIKQVFYRSKDRTRVSMFIVMPKAKKLDGSTPFILYGYGGFQISLEPRFSSSIIPWLESGGGYAVANLRGGSEYGEKWHRDGMLEKKQNVFDDFIAAAEFLIDKKYTRSNRLGIMGGSNGGLLVGAAMTQRPELFGAVVCAVPLLDMLRYHLFESGKTWISEYGSADDPKLFKTLYAYSPYHQIKIGVKYPPLLMLSADSDDRVDAMHARKFVARIRHASGSNHPVLLLVRRKAGHSGTTDTISKRVASQASIVSFFSSQLNLPYQQSQAKPAP